MYRKILLGLERERMVNEADVSTESDEVLLITLVEAKGALRKVEGRRCAAGRVTQCRCWRKSSE